MNFENEVRELYKHVHNRASRDCREYANQEKLAHPEALSTILEEKKISHSVNAGIMNIPVNSIVGVADSGERGSCYTRDFLPLEPENSEFAEKWCSLYLDCFTEEGIRTPIECYEYLGRFYVADGMKRVSVLKCFSIPTVSAYVTRLMPALSDDPEIQRYYKFLKHLKLTGLYQVSFRYPENFEKLQKAMGYKSEHAWTNEDRFRFMFGWYGFAQAYKRVFGEDRYMPAADVLAVVLEDYSYREISAMHPCELTKVLRSAWKKIYGALDLDMVNMFSKAS